MLNINIQVLDRLDRLDLLMMFINLSAHIDNNKQRFHNTFFEENFYLLVKYLLISGKIILHSKDYNILNFFKFFLFKRCLL